MKYRLNAAQTTYPVSEAELVDLLRLDDYTDPNLKFMLHSATDAVIGFIGRSLLKQEYTIQWDGFPGKGTETGGLESLRLVPDAWISLPYGPLIAVKSVTVIDLDGNVETTPSTDYVVDNLTAPGRLRFPYGFSAIIERTRLQIVYDAGYGENPEDVPHAIRYGILIAAGYLYEHRGECSAGSAITDSGAAKVLQPYRMLHL